MPYDYDECVSNVERHRRAAYRRPGRRRSADGADDADSAENPDSAAASSAGPDLDALQRASDAFADLSGKCPMTPLLWMQYAHDVGQTVEGLLLLTVDGGGCAETTTAAAEEEARSRGIESGLGVSEMGLSEFPGCAALWLYHLEGLCESYAVLVRKAAATSTTMMVGPSPRDGDGNVDEEIEQAERAIHASFVSTFRAVGGGSHSSGGPEGRIVAEIFRLHGKFLLCALVALPLKCDDNDGGGGQHVRRKERRTELLSRLRDSVLLRSHAPTLDGSNDGLADEASRLWDAATATASFRGGGGAGGGGKDTAAEAAGETSLLLSGVDAGRRIAACTAAALGPGGMDGVDAAVAAEGILIPDWFLRDDGDDESDDDNDGDLCPREEPWRRLKRSSGRWDPLLLPPRDDGGAQSLRCLMGLGGSETVRAYLRLVRFLEQKQERDEGVGDDDGGSGPAPARGMMRSLVGPVHERAASETPTSETVWASYLAHLGVGVRRARRRARKEEGGGGAAVSLEEVEGAESLLRSASDRAVRNCPYSANLFEAKMDAIELLSSGSAASSSSFEPDDLSGVVRQADELGFLNGRREDVLRLRLAAARIARRRLLSLVSLGTTMNDATNAAAAKENAGGEALPGGKDFDDEEPTDASPDGRRKKPSKKKKKKKTANDDDDDDDDDEVDGGGPATYRPFPPSHTDEAADLIDDVRDMYDDADADLHARFPGWADGRVEYWRDRAEAEAYVLSPLALALRGSDTGDDGGDKAVRCFERLVKAQKPSHPDAWRDYVRYVSGRHAAAEDGTTAAAVPGAIRRTRGLYRRAMTSVRRIGGSGKKSAPPRAAVAPDHPDPSEAAFGRSSDAALPDLCREYLSFERLHGSGDALRRASVFVQNKLTLADVVAEATAAADNFATNGKRKAITTSSGDDVGDAPMDDDGEDCDGGDKSRKRAKVKTNLKEPKSADADHKVRVGNMEYPAHPYTVHVFDLDKETVGDMDLVDAFRASAGPIVHAKIFREKHVGKGGPRFPGPSRGCGLVQFEDRGSVEKALKAGADGSLEVRGRPASVRRSHVPAVGVVPAGMHRVKPKGEGKSSMRNFRKKKQIAEEEGGRPQDRGKNAIDCDDEGGGGDGTPSSSRDATKEEAKKEPRQQPTLRAGGGEGRKGPPQNAFSMDVLSFRPRGVANKKKTKIALKNAGGV